jgi:hypothetical protein
MMRLGRQAAEICLQLSMGVLLVPAKRAGELAAGKPSVILQFVPGTRGPGCFFFLPFSIFSTPLLFIGM